MQIKSLFKNIINKVKNFFKILVNKYILVALIVIVAFVYFNYQKNMPKNTDDNMLMELGKEIENIASYSNVLQNNLLQLESKIKDYNNRILNYENDLLNLKDRIAKLENTNPINNERNIQIIILANNIKNLYYSNKTFVSELENLKILSKNRVDIYDKIIKLDNFIGKNSSFGNFKNEYRNLLKKTNKNKLKEFVSNNIQIRKIKSDESDKINSDIKNIENYIKLHEYKEALNIIKENKYENIFIETTKTLNNNMQFDYIIDGIISIIYNSY